MKNLIKLTLSLLALILPANVAAYDFEVDGIYYNIITSNEVEVTYKGHYHETGGKSRTDYDYYYNDYKGSITIPSSISYDGATYTVTQIGDYAFSERVGSPMYPTGSVESVIIPYTVTQIGKYAFEECQYLTSITIPSSVVSIKENAFCGSAWLSNQPAGIVYAGLVAYSYNGTMPNDICLTFKTGTKGIAEFAFADSSKISSIIIPNTILHIGSNAFKGCSEVTTITVASGNSHYDSRNNCNAIIETASNTLITGCNNTIIPSTVTSIGDYAFYNCYGLAIATIGNSVTDIGNSAFYGCSGLTGITIPNSVTTISDDVFYGCIGLKNLTIPNSVTTIGNGAFRGCTGLTSLTIPNSVTTISDGAFRDCTGLTNLTIPNSVTTIGYNAFRDCTAITTLNFNAISCNDFWHDIHWSRYAPFYNLNITTINIGENVQRIPACLAYSLTKLTSVTIPNSVTEIGNYAFLDCGNITNVTMSNSLASIGFQAFGRCISLTNVTIPNSVMTIGDYAFYQCSGLTNLTIGNSVISIGDYAFQKCPELETLCFNAISCTDFSSNASRPFYNLSFSTISIGDGVQKIPACLAYGMSNLGSLTISNSVTSIGDYAFYGCSKLTSVIIPNSVTNIGEQSFCNCSGLTSVSIGNSVNTIGGSAFYGCYGLTNVSIENLTSWCNIDFANYAANPLYYAHYLFLNNIEVTDLVIPNTVTSIHDYSFYNCLGMTSVTIPKTVTYIGNYAFNSCSNLAGFLTIPESVTDIGKQAFNNIPGIEAVTCEAVMPPSWNDLTMFTTNVYNHSPLYVPMGCARAYTSDQCWGQFAKIISTGDIDGNGKISIADVAELIDMLMSNDSINNPAADIDGDGRVSIADVSDLIDILLSN